jgi:hypothetical protein
MRTAILVAIMVAALLAGGCGTSVLYSANEADFDAWAQEMHHESKPIHLQNITNWMAANMRYESDGLIDWFKPWYKAWGQTGDCEDFAGVALEALHRTGRAEFVYLSAWHPGGGHTVCTDKNYHIGNWGLVFVGGLAYADVAAAVYPDWTKYIVRDRNLNKIEEVSK